MNPLRWLRGPLLEIPGAWPRWTYLLLIAAGMNLVAGVVSLQALAITPPPTGTTDPTLVPAPPDPTVTPLVVVGACMVLLGVVCVLAGRAKAAS